MSISSRIRATGVIFQRVDEFRKRSSNAYYNLRCVNIVNEYFSTVKFYDESFFPQDRRTAFEAEIRQAVQERNGVWPQNTKKAGKSTAKNHYETGRRFRAVVL